MAVAINLSSIDECLKHLYQSCGLLLVENTASIAVFAGERQINQVRIDAVGND
jgi:hypothetical protein